MDIIFIMKKIRQMQVVYAGKESGTESAGTELVADDAVKLFERSFKRNIQKKRRKQKKELLFFLMRQQPVLYWLC